ncbi:haloacid dehalogenase type II [Hymenobacter arizonensis]|uniref:2-haloacid dehalogenase n=1 Tax=Hymenobacter arizonensis TaxID=1227077 RepID=A0A1I5XWJ6_HYMAR|nr:haloacid dehalogenase type II [Hymenobacter arizonensis]SFQ36276.1 2-haloacid dehalogenase [Hymenobacter arizonensis]
MLPTAAIRFPQPGQLKVLFFDVNETLLDMSKLKKAVVTAFGDKSAFRQWFGLLLQYLLVDTVTERYHEFGVIANAALDMTAAKLETKPLKAVQKQKILALMTQLPAHPDVAQGLEMLREAGYRLVAFTNSTKFVLDQQLQYAGIMGYFEQGLSVDVLRRYKPQRSTYHEVARHLGVMPEQAALIAAHGWDIAGAQAAGLFTGFIARPGQELYPLAGPPTYHGKTLVEVARQMIG